jgi:hypothetical protein
MRIDNNGNVGIGTATPSAKLEVAGKTIVGATGIDNLPGGSNWNYTLQLNSLDTSSIGFHDAGNSVGSIRYKSNLFTIGADDGWGNATTYFPGNVGIGTTTPSQKLSITDTLAITNTAGIQYLLMGNQDSAGVNNPSIIRAANGSFEFGGGTSWSGIGGTFASSMMIADNGNVGIGTTTPTGKLDIWGVGSGRGIRLNPGDSGYIVSSYNASASNAEQFNIKHNLGGVEIRNERGNLNLLPTGNVGIGTTSPGAKMETIGEIRSSGAQNGFATVDRTDGANKMIMYLNNGYLTFDDYGV